MRDLEILGEPLQVEGPHEDRGGDDRDVLPALVDAGELRVAAARALLAARRRASSAGLELLAPL